MGNCKDCKHWDNGGAQRLASGDESGGSYFKESVEGNPGKGLCGALLPDNPLIRIHTIYAEEEFVWTAPAFGCVLFETKGP